MFGVKITGWGCYLPERVVTNEALTDWLLQKREELMAAGLIKRDDPRRCQFEIDPQWVLDRTGIGERRWAADHEATSDLAAAAGRAALEESGLNPAAVGFIIVATVTPDYPASPPTASLVQHQLAIGGPSARRHCEVYDVSVACSSFVAALSLGDALIRCGRHRAGLVIGADIMSRLGNPHDRGSYPLFGDAGACLVLERTTEAADQLGPNNFLLGSDGSLADLIMVPRGGSRRPFPLMAEAANPELDVYQSPYRLQMNGRAVYRQASRLLAEEVIPAALIKAEVKLEEIGAIVFHQANLRIIESVVEKLGYSGRVPVNIDRYGNTTSASIPLCLIEAAMAGEIRPNDLVFLIAVGGGLTWGTALLRWQ